jgi:hypothetical protein
MRRPGRGCTATADLTVLAGRVGIPVGVADIQLLASLDMPAVHRHC